MNNFVTVVRQQCLSLDLQLIASIIGMAVIFSGLWMSRKYHTGYFISVARSCLALVDATLICTAMNIVIYSLALIWGLWFLWSTKSFQGHHLSDLLWIVSQYYALLGVTMAGFAITIVAGLLLSIIALLVSWPTRPFWRTSHE